MKKITIELWIIYIKYFSPVCHLLDNFVVGFRTSGNLTSRDFTKGVTFYTHSGSQVGCGETLKVTCHECVTAYARYIIVWIPGLERVLMICEFEVYTEGKYHSFISMKANIRFGPYWCWNIILPGISNDTSELVWLMSWCRLGNKSLPALMITNLHIKFGIDTLPVLHRSFKSVF